MLKKILLSHIKNWHAKILKSSHDFNIITGCSIDP